MGPFTYESRTIRSVIYFLLKRGANHVYLASLKSGGGVGGGVGGVGKRHSARTSVLCHI